MRFRFAVALALALTLAGAGAARARPSSHTGGRVSVQPFDGTQGPALRQQIARLLRGRGFRVVTSIARVSGTGQYLSLARDRRLTAFVTGDMDEGRQNHSITFLVWNGATGSVLGRWSASGPPRRLSQTVAKGFWNHLGPALATAAAPPSRTLPPAPPMRIDAGEANGGAASAVSLRRRSP